MNCFNKNYNTDYFINSKFKQFEFKNINDFYKRYINKKYLEAK